MTSKDYGKDFMTTVKSYSKAINREKDFNRQYVLWYNVHFALLGLYKRKQINYKMYLFLHNRVNLIRPTM